MPNIIEINDLTLPEIKLYSCTSEIPLLRYFEPEPGIFIAESPNVISRALNAGYEPISILIDRKKVAALADNLMERCGDIPIYTADSGLLDQITGFHLTQGALCAMRRRELPDMETICSGASRIAVLEDIMNPTNAGAIFRSAAALNFDAVLLTSGCCDPLYRRSIRVSMGTVFQVPWAYLDSKDSDYVDKLKSMGFATAAMALRDDSVGIDNPKLMAETKLALIFGTEGEGLKSATIDACDHVVKIPMANGVDSLNVAAASAVAFWQLRKQ
ncbi:MAG: RNA methyltransferase [Acetatifactor sp.]|nr:RNA methyltransferase [Acetatifactor sp.]